MLIREAVLHAKRTNNTFALVNTLSLSLSKAPDIAMNSLIRLLNDLPNEHRELLLRAVEVLVSKRKLIDFVIKNDYGLPKEVLDNLMRDLECVDIIALGDLISKLPSVNKNIIQAYISRALKEPLCYEGKELALLLLSQGINSGTITSEELNEILAENKLRLTIVKRDGSIKEVRIVLNNEQLSNISDEVILNLLKAVATLGIVSM